MPDAIVARKLRKTFGPKLAVSDLDFNIPQGSLCGVIGPNGAGKTTTIRMIMSIIFPDSGELSVLGKPSAVESKDRIGYLPEERGLYKKMRVGAFLTYMAKLKGVDPGAASKKSSDWLERTDLPGVARKRCEELSKGMQQKVQFIAAVIHEPELLILDEVFSGLDPVNRRLMRELIEEQSRAGRTILFSTHGMYDAEQLCDRILMIHRGQKVLDCTLGEIRARFDPRTIVAETLDGASIDAAERLRSLPGVESVEPGKGSLTLRLAEGADVPEIFGRLALACPMRRIELKQVTLEDVFIDLVQASGETLRREDLQSADAPPRPSGRAEEPAHA
ncbi:MAG: ATP-binding cassette domain-containing protein [Phycisphaerales bacterium]|nr:ATP-binding cassette domain-containing protein [Phycisphaerales bacterium]